MLNGARRALLLVAVGLLCVLARRAHAEAPEAPRSGRTWYGWQIAISEGAGLALGVTVALAYPPADPSGTRRLLPVWGGMVLAGLVGPPVIHIVHGHVPRGAGDFALRLVVPFGTLFVGVVGYCVQQRFASGCGDQAMAPSLIIGTVAPAMIDMLVLAWDEPRPPKPAAVSVIPMVVPLAGGAGALFGARGSFF